MLAAEPGLTVTTVSLGTLDGLDEALAGQPDVVVFEEGGPIGILDVLRRSGATVIVDVDITSSTAWTLQRHSCAPPRRGPRRRPRGACVGPGLAVPGSPSAHRRW
jgi:hypothetical protein